MAACCAPHGEDPSVFADVEHVGHLPYTLLECASPDYEVVLEYTTIY